MNDRQRNRLILIVDDDRMMSCTLSDLLEREGFRTAVAADGDTALEMFSELRPDLVLLDLVMPGKDGLATCREMRQIPGTEFTPVLIVTSLDDTEVVQLAFEAGATDFISKPVQHELLVYRVRYMLHVAETMCRLADSEAALAHAQRTVHLGTWSWDPASGAFTGSAETFSILGSSCADFNLQGFLEAVCPSERAAVEAALNDLAAGNGGCCLEFRISREGVDRVVRLQGEGHAGTSCVRGTIQDVTEMRQAEERLQVLKQAVECLP
ncbi:MAG TPA: response regulator, partial [Verrucomicrobiae bacterium]|nr:response regulator [Verrucomicrobiae bacterium]